MQKLKVNFLMLSLLVGFFASATQAYAGSPSLSVFREGGGDNVRITINNADPNASVTLYRRQGTMLWTEIRNFGQTDSIGYFSQITSLGSDSTNNPVEQYVMVNSQQSSVVSIYPNGSTGGCVGLGCGSSGSQQNINLAVGQTFTTTFSGLYYGSPIYIASNSDSSISTATVSGTNTILFTGLRNGQNTITVCQNSYGNCVAYYVSVGGNYYGAITFAQSSVALSVNQSQNVAIYSSFASFGSYYISSNSNPAVVSASISGTSVYLTGRENGSATVTVCQTSTSACGNLTVTVSPSGNVSFNPPSLQLSVGQTATVVVYSSLSSYNSFYVSANSNSSAVIVTSMSGSNNRFTVYGNSSGNANITICQYSSTTCGLLSVSVGGQIGFPLSFSQNNISLSLGQSSSVNIFGGVGGYYVSSNTNPGAVSTNIAGNQINVYAASQGVANISVCAVTGANCATLYVTSSGFGGNNNSGNLYLNSSSLNSGKVSQYYSQSVSVSGGNAPYFFTLVSGSLPNGLTLSSSGQISGTPQIVQNSTFTLRVTDSFGRSASSGFSINIERSGSSVLGESIYASGQLISENGTVYIVYNGTKTGFTSSAVFNAFGYKFANVLEVGDSGLADSGYAIQTARNSHPWGSWIRWGRQVYFVHENGLIPVPNVAVLQSNGGHVGLLVPANRFDLNLPVLSSMQYNDLRLN